MRWSMRLSMLLAGTLSVGATARLHFAGKVVSRSEALDRIYDYVVVGGGLSGLVVANRLSENPNTTVLVIEAGPFDDDEDYITIPLLSTGNVPSLMPGAVGTKYDWNTSSTAQPQLLNRSLSLPAGKVVGGGTILNGMVLDRGSAGEYDRWEALGNPGWNFENLLHYFKKAEVFTPPIQLLQEEWGVGYVQKYHGEGGFVHSSFQNFVWPSTRNFIGAMLELGVKIVKDSMGGDAAGAFWFLVAKNPADESRSSAETFYLPERTNLHLLPEHQVTKVLLETSYGQVIATGVEYASDKSETRHTALAKKDVVLAAGALFSPQILQLSGIGDGRHLEEVGIETVVDLPGVGANQQDHLMYVTVQTVNTPVNIGNFSNTTWASEQRALYDEKREGPFATVAGNFFAFLPLKNITTSEEANRLHSQASAQDPSAFLPEDTHPTVLAGYKAQRELLIQDILSPDSAHLEFIFSDGAILPGLQQPFSRGTIRLNNTSPFDSPLIDPRYLSNPLDLSVLATAFYYTRTIRATAAMKAIDALETYPGVTLQAEGDVEAFVRGNGISMHHHSGTASMLPRSLGGVVDSKLRVYGVEGLRVVDASVVPMLPAAHLTDTIYAVAEKAADLIKDTSRE